MGGDAEFRQRNVGSFSQGKAADRLHKSFGIHFTFEVRQAMQPFVIPAQEETSLEMLYCRVTHLEIRRRRMCPDV